MSFIGNIMPGIPLFLAKIKILLKKLKKYSEKNGNCTTKPYHVDSGELFLICFLFYKKPATAIAGPVIFSNGRVESPMKITRLRGFFFASGTITIQVGFFIW
jgi:hypothetical protein